VLKQRLLIKKKTTIKDNILALTEQMNDKIISFVLPPAAFLLANGVSKNAALKG